MPYRPQEFELKRNEESGRKSQGIIGGSKIYFNLYCKLIKNSL